MELKDIGAKELKELNLYPLRGLNQLKTCIEFGYCDIYKLKNSVRVRRCKSDTYFLPKYRDQRPVDTEIPNPEHWFLEHRIVIKDFDSISDEELVLMGFSTPSLCKIKWLKKYLKGEVHGAYSKNDDEYYLEMITSKEILEQNETIRNLNLRIYKLQEENRILKETIAQNEKEVLNAKKLKSKCIKILSEFEAAILK